MENIKQEDELIIKEMQQLLLEKTTDIDVASRSLMYSQFNKVRYKLLSEEEGRQISETAEAFYDPNDLTIYIIGDDRTNIRHKILHEMIHSVTHRNPLTRITSIGIEKIENASYESNSLRLRHYKALNEAGTEFYTFNFLKDDGYAYANQMFVYNYLSQVCGFDKLKQAFFSCDINNVKEVVRKGFCLDDNILIDKLFTQMDNMLELFMSNNKNGELFMFKECCSTLFEMGLNRAKRLNNKFNNTELMVRISFLDLFDSFQVLTKYLYDTINVVDKMIGRHLYELVESVNKPKNEIDAKSLAIKIIQSIGDDRPIDDYLDVIKKNMPVVLAEFNKDILFVNRKNPRLDKRVVYYEFLLSLTEYDGKIDMSKLSDLEKDSVIISILFNPHLQKNEIPYIIFKDEDIISFVNRDPNNWIAFKDKGLLKECIIPNLAKISSQIKNSEKFKNRIFEIILDKNNKNKSRDLKNYESVEVDNTGKTL